MSTALGSFVEELLEQGQSFVGQLAKAAVKTPTDLAKAGASQVAGQASDTSHADASTNQTHASDHANNDLIKDLYAPSKSASAHTPPSASAHNPNGKTPLEEAHIDDARKKLQLLQQQHKEMYYDPTFNLPKKQEETKAEEKEREEQEKQMQLMEEQKDKLPELPVGVRQGTGEKLTGVSG